MTRTLWLTSVMVVVAAGSSCSGCRRGQPLLTEGEAIAVDPATLDFGDVPRGEGRTLRFEVLNQAVFETPVELEVEGRFASEVGALVLPPVSSEEVFITFAPIEETQERGAVVISVPGRPELSRTVTLVGRGVAGCRAPSCHTVGYDSVTNACTFSASADGTACRDTCLGTGSCHAGSCRVEANGCDDANPCTLDACGAEGCLHQALECAPSTNPCLVNLCDAREGCVAVPVADGLSCGASDCQTSNVCIAGACVQRPTPNGATCAPALRCRSESTCVDGVCVQGESVPLRPAWRASGGGQFDVDAKGRVFSGLDSAFLSDGGYEPAVTRLVGYDSAGKELFNLDLAAPDDRRQHIMLLAADADHDLVYVGLRSWRWQYGNRGRVMVLQARSSTTGALVWEKDLTTTVRSLHGGPDGTPDIESYQATAVEDGVVAFSIIEGDSIHTTTLLALSALTGEERWRVERSGHASTRGGANGQIWQISSPCWSENTEFSLFSRGVTVMSQPRWVLTPVAATETLVGFCAVDGGAGLCTLSSTWESTQIPLPLKDLSSSQVRIEGQALTVTDNFARGSSLSDGGWQVDYDVKVHRYDRANRHLLWSRPYPSSVDEVELLEHGRTAVSWLKSFNVMGLETISANGEALDTCTMEGNSLLAITQGKAYVRGAMTTEQTGYDLLVYDTPGLEVAPTGWATRSGGLGRLNRPR